MIRLQRVGRKGLSQFRIIVQEKKFAPKSGKILEIVGTYNPHSKQAVIDKDAVNKYFKNGAQPSDRVKKIFKAEKISMPSWVQPPLKRNRPTKAKKTEGEAPSTKATPDDKPADEAPSPSAEAAEDKKADEAVEAPVEEKAKTEQKTEEASPSAEATQDEKPAEEAPAPEEPEK